MTSLWQAARASSAAPVYFTPYLEGASTFVDGGIGCNNPAGFALQEAHILWPNLPVKVIVSLGTGQVPAKKQSWKFGDLNPLGYLSLLETVVEVSADLETFLTRWQTATSTSSTA